MQLHEIASLKSWYGTLLIVLFAGAFCHAIITATPPKRDTSWKMTAFLAGGFWFVAFLVHLNLDYLPGGNSPKLFLTLFYIFYGLIVVCCVYFLSLPLTYMVRFLRVKGLTGARKIVHSENNYWQIKAIHTLLRSGFTEDYACLFKIYLNPGAPKQVRSEIQTAIKGADWKDEALREILLPALHTALESAKGQDVDFLATMIGGARDKRSIQPLILKLLHHTPSDCLKKALDQIDRHWSKSEAAQQTLPEVQQGLSSVHREAALFLLGAIPNSCTPAMVADHINDGRVSEMLAKISSSDRIQPLLFRLKSPESWIVSNASNALYQIDPNWAKSEAAQKILNNFFSDLMSPEKVVRVAAANALTAMDWQPTEPLHKVWFAIAKEKWDEAAECGKIAVKPLASLLQDCPPGLVTALALIGDESALLALIEHGGHLDEIWDTAYTGPVARPDDLHILELLQALESFNDIRCLDVLVKILRASAVSYTDEIKHRINDAALEAVVRLGDVAIKPLTAANLTNELPIIRALCKLSAPDLIPLIAGVISYASRDKIIRDYLVARFTIAVPFLVSRRLNKSYGTRYDECGRLAVVVMNAVGDARVLDPLLEAFAPHVQEHDTFGAEISGLIERVLRLHAPNASLNALRVISLFPDSLSWTHTVSGLGHADPEDYTTEQILAMRSDVREHIDYSHVKNLARSELLRRGEQ